MSGGRTGRRSKKKGSEPRTNWRRVRCLTSAQIRVGIAGDQDIKPTHESFWSRAEVVLPQTKKTVTMRLDADLLDWFRTTRGYQTRINAILRAYMNAHDRR